MKKTLRNIILLLSFMPFIMKGQDWQSLGPNRLPKGYSSTYPHYCAKNAGNGAFFTIACDPANDQVDVLYYINIDNGNTGEISLLNAEGKLVKKEQVYAMASIKTIDVSNLVAGVYQIILQQNGVVLANTKLVIVH